MSPELQHQYLVAATQEKDHKATEILFSFLLSRILPFCIKNCPDRATAEDIANESVYYLFEFAQNKPIDDPLNWTYKVAKNQMKDNYRRLDVREKYASVYKDRHNEFKESDIEVQVDISIIEEIIDQRLSEEEKQLWSLNLEGYNNSELAEVFQVPKTNLSKYKFRIREKLKRLVKALGGPEIS